MLKMYKFIFSGVMFCLAWGIPEYQSMADSLWNDARGPIYSSVKREIRVGDVITVFVSESTTAAQQATTRTSKESEVNMDILQNFIQVASLGSNDTNRRTNQLEFGGGDEFDGTGQTTRRSRVNAVVTAIVTEILEGGNVFIVGEKKVKVNNEVETIRISGVVRPADIRADNTVFSYQVAKAEVSVNGAGVVGAKQNPGVVTKMFNWLF